MSGKPSRLRVHVKGRHVYDALAEIAGEEQARPRKKSLGVRLRDHDAIEKTIDALVQAAEEEHVPLREAIAAALVYGIDIGYHITLAAAGYTPEPGPDVTRQ